MQPSSTASSAWPRRRTTSVRVSFRSFAMCNAGMPRGDVPRCKMNYSLTDVPSSPPHIVTSRSQRPRPLRRDLHLVQRDAAPTGHRGAVRRRGGPVQLRPGRGREDPRCVRATFLRGTCIHVHAAAAARRFLMLRPFFRSSKQPFTARPCPT